MADSPTSLDAAFPQEQSTSGDAVGLSVRFWGVRGTVPCPGPSTLRYGGNTACVEVSCGEHRLIFDAGTGVRQLGKAIAKDPAPASSHLFLSHTHMDHVNGLPFFKPAYDPQNRFEFWAGHLARQGRKLDDVLCCMMQAPFFPVPLDIMHACIAFHDFEAGETLHPCDEVLIRTAPLNHPGGATGYRVEFRRRTVCYITDTEHEEGRPDQAILALIENADLVVYDATYTDAEYQRFRGWGHSTWEEGVRLCQAAGARRLVTFHHDPEHDDTALDRIGEELAQRHAGSLVAAEGLVIDL